MRASWISTCASLALISACSDDGALAANGATGTTGGMTPAPLCVGGGPLESGDAEWVKAPFAPPGGEGEDGEGEDEGGEDGGWGTAGGGFIDDPDGGGVTFECDIWAQDCPEGEKCVPWANDGGEEWNATRCVPIADMPGEAGEPCMVEGSPTSGIDDCEAQAMCWDVGRDDQGTCIAMCTGDEASPMCPEDQWCFSGYDGSVAVCLPKGLCGLDGVCQCLCPEGSDPDCEVDQCAAAHPEAEKPEELVSERPVHTDGEPVACPDTQDPVVLYMSNDDSNSQASPILARRTISEGWVPSPHVIRIHEFLNYFDLTAEPQEDGPVGLGIEMRRTNAEAGEFTLVLRAQGRALAADERPPFNLVFSLDTSGSMGGEPIELLKDTMAAAVGQLRAGDVVSIVTWNNTQSIELAGYEVSGPGDLDLLAIIENLYAGGSTNLHQGLVTAYQLANDYHIDDGINRVVLISDGGANAGITDLDLIASEASDADGEGTYMVGVGVGSSYNYRDDLMDRITDAGKGAYVFVDRPQEAYTQLGDRFLANMTVVARNVRMRLDLPWYFGIKAFHGEEYSSDPAEVEPQHLAANDAMTFHQIVSACDPSLITTCDSVTASVEYFDPITGLEQTEELTAPIEWLVEQPVPRLRKADVVVGYAKALIVIGHLHYDLGQTQQAEQVASNMQQWAQEAAAELGDEELQEIAEIMGQLVIVLGSA